MPPSIDDIHEDVVNKIYYFAKEYELTLENNVSGDFPLNVTLSEGSIYSAKWGIAFRDFENAAGDDEVELTYIHPDSPFNDVLHEGETFDIESEDFTLTTIMFVDDPSADNPVFTPVGYNSGAQAIIDQFELEDYVSKLVLGGDIIIVNFSYKLMDEGEKPVGYDPVPACSSP